MPVNINSHGRIQVDSGGNCKHWIRNFFLFAREKIV